MYQKNDKQQQVYGRKTAAGMYSNVQHVRQAKDPAKVYRKVYRKDVQVKVQKRYRKIVPAKDVQRCTKSSKRYSKRCTMKNVQKIR